MKSFTTLVLLFFFLIFTASAQKSGPISIEKKGLKKTYMLDGKEIDAKMLNSLLKANTSSNKNFKSYQANSIAAFSSIVVGTGFIGAGFYYSIKSAQSVGDNDLSGTSDYSTKSTNNLLIGAGFYLLSVPFNFMANSNLGKSIDLYNSSQGNSMVKELDLYFGFSNDGLGVGLKF